MDLQCLKLAATSTSIVPLTSTSNTSVSVTAGSQNAGKSGGNGNGISTGGIVGAAIGGVATLLLLTVAVFLAIQALRRRQSQRGTDRTRTDSNFLRTDMKKGLDPIMMGQSTVPIQSQIHELQGRQTPPIAELSHQNNA